MGYTSATSNGSMGGIIGANARCAAQFAGSHLCTTREFQWASVDVSPGAQGAWVDGSQFSTNSYPNQHPRDRDSSYTCSGWTNASNTNDYSSFLSALGTMTSPANGTCGQQRPLACCTSPYAWFRGFTASTSTGNLGGLLAANARCSAEFPRSHLCTSREFEWAGVSVSPGPQGAWLDGSRSSTSSYPNQEPRDRDGSYTCNTWTSSSGTNDYSSFLTPLGVMSSPSNGTCAVARPLGCCGG